MSGDGSITIFWGDGENKFRLGIGEFRELQERTNRRRSEMGLPSIGPRTLGNEIRANDAWPDDVRDVLRIGLVGAGLTPADAHSKLVLYFDKRPPLESYLPAYSVLMAAFVGVPGDEIVSKKKTRKKRVQTVPSPSPDSTQTAPS